MDGLYYRLEGGRQRGLLHARVNSINVEKEKSLLCGFFSYQGWLLQKGFLHALHPTLCSEPLWESKRKREEDGVVCCPKRSWSWSTSWQLSLVTEAETTQCSSSVRTGFRGLPDSLCTFQSSGSPSNHLIEMRGETDISVFPWLQPPHPPLLSVINCLDGWFPFCCADRNMLLLSYA